MRILGEVAMRSIDGEVIFTNIRKHGKVEICGSGKAARNNTHDTASQPRTERMLLQWNRAKRPLI